MAKYIDADALLAQMKDRRFYVGRQSDPVCIIEDAPAADVEPVRYGQWVKTIGMAPPEFIGSYHCSECGWYGRSRKEREYKRCPECGAKMGAEPPKEKVDGEDISICP